MRAQTVLWCIALALAATFVQAQEREQTCPMVRLEAERLPDLHIPRAGHLTLVVDGELMVAGGHTDGFVPTATAEFLRPGDRAWRVHPTVYTHDFGTSAQLHSGEVLLIGGAAEPLGIGQNFHVERYDPVSRTFEGFGCLDVKRMYASAEELTDGQVLVTGNWYHRDAMELFDGEKFFTYARNVQRARACPFIFPAPGGDALVLGAIDSIGGAFSESSATVERLRGEAFDVPLLREWQPIPLLYPHPARASFVGNEAAGDYSYLVVLATRDYAYRIARVQASAEGDSSAITFLPGLPPLPTKGPEGQDIGYISSVLVDSTAKRGYVVGHDVLLNLPANARTDGRDSLARHYVFAFDYEGQLSTANCQLSTANCQLSPVNCQLSTLYYTDPLPGVGMTTPVLLPNGDIAIVAGAATDNFAPFSAAYLLPVGRHDDEASTAAWHRWLLWLLVGMAALLLLGGGMMRRRRRRTAQQQTIEEATSDSDVAEESTTPPTDLSSAPPVNDLMPRIITLMEEERPYLHDDLKLSDIADVLGVHRNYVSDCINTQQGCTFPQFIAGYRIRHARQLLREHPDMKLSAVAAQSGFANETTFFRAFKAIVGMTPREWIASATGNPGQND